MTSSTLKEIKTLCSEGRFKELRAALLEGDADIDTKAFLEILRACGWFCKKTSNKESIDYIELFDVLKLNVRVVKELPGADLENYLRCLYNCLAIPFKEEYFSDLQTLQDILLPRCSTWTSTMVYSSFAKVLHNNTLHNMPSSDEKLPQIVQLMLKLCKAASDTDLMLNIMYNMFFQMFKGKQNVERLEECYCSFTSISKGMDFEQQQLVNVLAPIIMKIMTVRLQSHDFQNLQTFLENLRHDFICKEYQHLLNVLNFVIVLSPSKLSCKYKALNATVNSIEKLKLKPSIITELFSITKVILKYYKASTDHCWQELIGELQTKILTFLCKLSKIVCTSDTAKDNCICGCTANKSTVNSVVCFETIALLIDLSLDSSPDHVTYLNILLKYSNEISCLKENNCVYLASSWSSFGNLLFSFGERSNNNKYFKMLVKNYFKFQARRANITPNDLVSKVILSFRRYVSEDPQSILSFCALASHLSPLHRRQFLSLWLMTKYNVRNDSLESTTMVRAIELLDWTKFDVNVDVSTEDRIDLLVYELESYKKNWQSKTSMMAALKELHMTADCSKVAQVAVRIFGECNLPVHGDVVKIISNVIRDYKTRVDRMEEKLYLSKLYFMVYKFRLIENGHKTCMEIEKNMSIRPLKDAAATSDVTDSEDECDVVSSYSSLRLDRCVEEWKCLDKSLELISAQSKKMDLSKFSDLNLYGLVMKIAFEYQMNCHHFKTLEALELALKIAQSEDNPSNVIHTVSYLLKISSEWLTVGEKFLPLLNSEDTKTLVIYYICKAEACLRMKDVETSYENFKLALNLFENKEIEDRDFIKCRLILLEMKYTDLPCDTFVSASEHVHDPRVLARAFKTYEVALSRMKSTSLNAEILSTVFDLAEGLCAFYHRMKEPRAVRKYASNLLILAQKMVLPARCATLLAYLTFADVHTGHYEDCDVKLSGMSDILVLRKRRARVVSDEESESVADGMRMLSLDAGDVPRSCLDESPSRQYLSVECLEIPPSCQHDKSCECFYCVCLEYQVWVLMAIRLDLVKNMREKRQVVVEDLRYSADCIYDRYLQRYHDSRSSLKTAYDYINSKVMISYCYVLLDHTRFLMTTNHQLRALNTIDKLFKIVTLVKTDCSQLYAETIIMKLLIKRHTAAMDVLLISTAAIDLEGTNDTKEIMHTPIGHNHLPPPSVIPQFAFTSPEPLKALRVPKLIFSPENSVPSTPKLGTSRRRLHKDHPEEDLRTPKPKLCQEEPQTPVIWVDPPDEAVTDSVSKSARRKGKLQEAPQSATRQTRSKLLVEKLKSVKSEQDEQESMETVKKSCRKLRPRKNLMF